MTILNDTRQSENLPLLISKMVCRKAMGIKKLMTQLLVTDLIVESNNQIPQVYQSYINSNYPPLQFSCQAYKKSKDFIKAYRTGFLHKFYAFASFFLLVTRAVLVWLLSLVFDKSFFILCLSNTPKKHSRKTRENQTTSKITFEKSILFLSFNSVMKGALP